MRLMYFILVHAFLLCFFISNAWAVSSDATEIRDIPDEFMPWQFGYVTSFRHFSPAKDKSTFSSSKGDFSYWEQLQSGYSLSLSFLSFGPCACALEWAQYIPKHLNASCHSSFSLKADYIEDVLDNVSQLH